MHFLACKHKAAYNHNNKDVIIILIFFKKMQMILTQLLPGW